MIGGIVDFFFIPTMVREANLRYRYREILYDRMEDRSPLSEAKRPGESVERIILRTAKKNGGVVTPAEVALEGDVAIDEAQKYLEKLAAKGFAEMRIRKSGAIVFYFPEFLSNDRTDFEEI